MKILNCIIIFILFPVLLLAQNTDYENRGDEFFYKRNQLKNGKYDVFIIDQALKNYNEALKKNPYNDELLYKYTKAIDFKYTMLPLKWDAEEKEKIFEDLIEKLERCYKKKPNSKYINCALARMWGRYGELIGVLSVAKKGIAGTIKEHALKLYKKDKSFEHHSACLVLGRMHYKVPVIPLFLTWPDMDDSKKYLEEAYKNEPDLLIVQFFLADTLYELDEINQAKKLFKSVMKAKIDPEFYFEQLKTKNDCKKRMKELGIIK